MFLPSGSGEIQIEARTADASAESMISALEWRVALLARRDADHGGWQAGEPRFRRLRRLIEMVTGTRGLQRLADERLEKLRIFIWMRRRGDRRAETAAAELVAMGFAPLALHRLEAVAAR